MSLPDALKDRQLADIVLHSILFLFFLQLISEFVEAIYAFGLLGTSLPVEIASVLLLFSPVILLFLPQRPARWAPVFLGALMLACRVITPLVDTRGKMLIAGFGVACFLILLPLVLRNQKDGRRGFVGLIVGLGLSLGLLLSILLRTLNSGSDISSSGWYQIIGWFLAIVAGALMFFLWRPDRVPSVEPQPDGTEAMDEAGVGDRPSFWKTAGLCLGLVAVFVLCYFAFASPNVIARWAGADYRLIIAAVVLVLCLFALLLASKPGLLVVLTLAKVLVWNLLFVLSMVLAILAHQIRFPVSASAYPLPEPVVASLHYIPLFLMLVLFPVILIDLILFVQELVASKPSLRSHGGGFSLASLYLLFMIFAQVFTTVYDYIPVVAPFFRDKFWFVFLLGGLVLTLPVLLVRLRTFDLAREAAGLKLGRAFSAVVVLVSVLTVAGAVFSAASPAAQPAQQSTLKILTYNIRQGYSEAGLRNYEGQLDLLREVDADVIGLQESDTSRIAGGNRDVVRYFADGLDLYSYYGPKTVPGTFGIALLSKVPIENPRTFYMYSEGEQTATIEAQVTVGGRTFDVLVTHLGNGGPMVQQEAILQSLPGTENLVLMGDFNFRPDTDQYRLTTDVLDDSWLLVWPQGNDGQGIDPAARIDHIFVSPGTSVTASEYLPGPQSDHPAMTSVIEW